MDLEEFEGESLYVVINVEIKEDIFDLFYFIEFYCFFEVIFGIGSLIWDYEKLDFIKFMNSS